MPMILEAPIATPAVAGGEGWGRGGLLYPNLFSVLAKLKGCKIGIDNVKTMAVI